MAKVKYYAKIYNSRNSICSYSGEHRCSCSSSSTIVEILYALTARTHLRCACC